jgi:hypothetical protein
MKRFVIQDKVEKNPICTGVLVIIFFMIISSCNSHNYGNYRYVVSSWKPDYHLFYNKNIQPVPVGFVCRESEPDDAELYKMIDEAIFQVFGEKGLRAIIKPGDKVVSKPCRRSFYRFTRAERPRYHNRSENCPLYRGKSQGYNRLEGTGEPYCR